jgi:carbonic anhydrase
MKFDNTTLYLKGWHIHSPSEHLLEGHRARSELHLVHADASGKERAVVGVLIDPGSTFTADSGFFSQFLETVPSWDDSHTKLVVEMDLRKVYEEIGAGATRRSPAGGERGSGGRDGEKQALKQFITYSGSLTSPPCTEGLRWFVSTTVLKLSTSQMQKLLGVSTYSARVVQEVWAHGVNV